MGSICLPLLVAKVVGNLVKDVFRADLLQGNFAPGLRLGIDQLFRNLKPGTQVGNQLLDAPS